MVKPDFVARVSIFLSAVCAAFPTAAIALRSRPFAPARLTVRSRSLYPYIHRKIEKWLFGRAEFLRNSIAPARIGLFSRKNLINGPPPEIRKKTGKSVEPLAGRNGRGCGMARKGGMPEPLFHATRRNVCHALRRPCCARSQGEAPGVRGFSAGPGRIVADHAADRSALPCFTHAPRSRLLAPCALKRSADRSGPDHTASRLRGFNVKRRPDPKALLVFVVHAKEVVGGFDLVEDIVVGVNAHPGVETGHIHPVESVIGSKLNAVRLYRWNAVQLCRPALAAGPKIPQSLN